MSALDIMRTTRQSATALTTPPFDGLSINRKTPYTPDPRSAGNQLKGVTEKATYTPIENVVDNMKRRLEQQMHGEMSDDGGCKTSPGLAKLRMTPARLGLREKQKILEKKHVSAKNKSDSLSIGGGICIWPEMTNMRLSATETWHIVVVSVLLAAVTVGAFHCVHGQLEKNLQIFYQRVYTFHGNYPLSLVKNETTFTESVVLWHTAFTECMDDISATFDIRLDRTTIWYQLCATLYVASTGVLLYYLADNILTKNKLSPPRIKKWICLLTVVGTWTLLLLKLLIQAQNLELAVEKNVHKFSEYLGDLIHYNYTLTTYHNVLLYWRTRCLPPTAHGTLNILGILPLRDVSYYLQYYSLPLITALLSPVVQLVISLRTVYSTKVH